MEERELHREVSHLGAVYEKEGVVIVDFGFLELSSCADNGAIF